MKAVFKTDHGKLRLHNEDNGGVFWNEENDLLAVVADGMGGHNAGDVASEMTKEKISELWSQSSKVNAPSEAESWLTDQVKVINRHIYEHANQNPDCEGMGTTLVAAICHERFVTIAHIGDSRVYILNDLGLQQLTSDHSLVNELVRLGQISKEDAEHHPRKHWILKSLGTEPNVEADIKTITFEEGDILLLCSDGLSNKLSEGEMGQILQESISLEEKADRMIGLANEYGGEDNITLVIVEYQAGSESG
ncbi:Stp1/IreP family PP2C-type Ser/Thr phosphatase [Falsibacillus albus]|uniref:protein-serine/threonine phosphatase n=1 Tax=Falsibacillus albus TaxID=2478915 RepID=A0A3L7K0K8_9BACI|nr:Stp1/IreP family PP2C-type Ser/Thr phosphatase [Falsibacillus albus]RLQ95929.1 Stp1/IreP family PP2C-type Ser/Thr phosphatase [Falsibacillus albus]